MLKRVTSLLLVFCLFFTMTTPAWAKKAGGAIAKPKPTTNQSSPSKTNDSGTAKTETSGDKIPYTNLPSSKAATGAGAAAGAATAGRSNLSGFAPSFSPFSGNFWMWMFLMNSFGHRPAAAQTEGGAELAQAAAGSAAESAQSEIYTPGVADYWEADPVANTVSTLLLVATVALPIWFFLRWRKKRASLN
ncbi:hypothetical protein [Desulforamulus aquiferis]|uniref:Uncharacterized protein n=1 Tax=Desulforamulus aquiferis TaxID=1397668 RepID=A0AAW7ZEZ3_9FIRM|nr:hypothetical protein [Desulforamulus aquiferis]MDO7788318.1 hypothetical protein [Desulforamulus aquiferis]